jgi:hypothetical protein
MSLNLGLSVSNSGQLLLDNASQASANRTAASIRRRLIKERTGSRADPSLADPGLRQESRLKSEVVQFFGGRKLLKDADSASPAAKTAQSGEWLVTDQIGLENVNTEFQGNFGFYFEPVRPFSIRYLGSFDNGRTGLEKPMPARLWEVFSDAENFERSNTLLSEVIVPPGIAGRLVGDYRFARANRSVRVLPGKGYAVTVFYTRTSSDPLQKDRYLYNLSGFNESVVQLNPRLFTNTGPIESVGTIDDPPGFPFIGGNISAINAGINTSGRLRGRLTPPRWVSFDE